ncbi:MAG: hypothetical protein J6S60_06095, partial [Oscillospiraceae bacterium]|nr:hypothetical protein [Oscillospiraceae bacterium]
MTYKKPAVQPGVHQTAFIEKPIEASGRKARQQTRKMTCTSICRASSSFAMKRALLSSCPFNRNNHNIWSSAGVLVFLS